MRHLIFTLMVLTGIEAFSQELVEKTFSVSTKETETIAARRDLQEQAVRKATEDLAVGLMGPEKYEKNKAVIQNKIFKLSGKYISFMKPGDMVASSPGPGFTMNYVMRVQPLNMKALLQTQGLLSENDTLPVVLPLVSFYDRVGVGTYKWWQVSDLTTKRFLVTQARNFERSLRASFKKQQFHLIRPMEMNASQVLPYAFQVDRFSPDDKDFMGRMFNAPLVLDGQIEFNRSQQGSNLYQIDIKLSALQLSNNRPIADVSRKYETDAGTFETVVDKKMKEILDSATQDLASQVYEAWQKGTVGTNIIRLTVRGNVPFKQREGFKEKIRTQIPQIKNIRERSVTSDSISFEIDTSATPQEIGQKMNSLDIGGGRLISSSLSEREVVLDLKR